MAKRGYFSFQCNELVLDIGHGAEFGFQGLYFSLQLDVSTRQAGEGIWAGGELFVEAGRDASATSVEPVATFTFAEQSFVLTVDNGGLAYSAQDLASPGRFLSCR